MTGIAVEVAVGGITEIAMMIVVAMVAVVVMVVIVTNRHESSRDGHPGKTV